MFLSLTIGLIAQGKKEKDVESIKKMCGCFEVTFKFSETFHYSNDTNYKPSKTKTSRALEWAQLVTDEEDSISIQHLLVVGESPNEFIIKHWRQDWYYQNKDFYVYNGNNTWMYEPKEASSVANQWTQKVYQVDDSPRYEGSGSWVHIDGKSYWESSTNAPLPRREYTTRSDYNIVRRGNRHEITSNGWVHDQDNKKIIRQENLEDTILAEEKGYNTYVRVSDKKCESAKIWWKKNHDKWHIVRNVWNKVYAENKTLTLLNKVENKVLYKYLFSDEFTTEQDIQNIIYRFIKNRVNAL